MWCFSLAKSAVEGQHPKLWAGLGLSALILGHLMRMESTFDLVLSLRLAQSPVQCIAVPLATVWGGNLFTLSTKLERTVVSGKCSFHSYRRSILLRKAA